MEGENRNGEGRPWNGFREIRSYCWRTALNSDDPCSYTIIGKLVVCSATHKHKENAASRSLTGAPYNLVPCQSCPTIITAKYPEEYLILLPPKQRGYILKLEDGKGPLLSGILAASAGHSVTAADGIERSRWPPQSG